MYDMCGSECHVIYSSEIKTSGHFNYKYIQYERLIQPHEGQQLGDTISYIV